MENLFRDAFNKTAWGSILSRIGPEYSIYFKPKKKTRHPSQTQTRIHIIHTRVCTMYSWKLFTSIVEHVSDGTYLRVVFKFQNNRRHC